MSKVICTHKDLIPQALRPDVDYFSMYTTEGRGGVSTVGTGLIREVLRSGLSPSVSAWDFLTLALAVNAADLAVVRAASADGWTRTIDLQVALVDPTPFLPLRAEIAEALRFLTGDFWRLDFVAGGEPPPRSTAMKAYDADCVSLLSGGLDSLVGALDLAALGQRPLFVSQIAKGDSSTQLHYARSVGGADRHIQWNHNVKVVHPTERSTRGRSIVFFAFAALAADALAQQQGASITVYVPENGLISLNIPLNAGRVGSLSTKTTHPVFMTRLQGIWNALGIPGTLYRPYAYLTKGEMLLGCRDQPNLSLLAPASTSCGRFGYYGYTHCGRCVPCMVRRASFMRAGMPDRSPKGYVFNHLSLSRPATGADDIGAAARAVLSIQVVGAAAFSAGQFAFASSNERRQFEGVVQRGFAELGALLNSHGVL
ncbi:MAG: Qat anti-phage system QueC-like protein QatC [Ottowia sp.]|uniref:Qat anti-phage system QueC-like protein QatC n=1 Tax=Ottowia sp. TaxID=1898956 RepID=UPI003C782577